MKNRLSCITALILSVLLLAGCASSGNTVTASGQQSADGAVPAAQNQNNPETSGAAPTVNYTDDLNRTVTLPSTVTKVAVTGPIAQMYMVSIGGDLLAGFVSAYSKDAAKYLPAELQNLPELGQLYGGKGTLNLEELLKADPDLVLDLGQAKDHMAEDFDALSEQTGIPFVHINTDLSTAPEALRKLGVLLGREEKGEELASYLEKLQQKTDELMEKVDGRDGRVKVIYCLGPAGLNVLADGSYHAEAIGKVAKNVAVVEEVSPTGDGNETDLEQLMLWDPEVILFAPDSVWAEVGDDPAWKQLSAIGSGKYYETPFGPYGWLQSPPAIQTYLGIMWLESLLYGEECGFDVQSEVTEYYRLFYGYDLTEEDYRALTANSFPKT